MSKLVSRWADDPELVNEAKKQDTTKSVKKSIESKWSSPTSSEKGKPLESKWASPVTSEKGKPLASRWADAPDEPEAKEDNSSKRSSPKRQHRKNHEKPAAHADLTKRFGKNLQIDNAEEEDERVEMSPEAKKFASRLGISSGPSPKEKIKFNEKPIESQGEDEWEDEDEDEVEEQEVEETPTVSTKGAQDFASRLGISLNGDKAQIRNKREEERKNFRNKRISSGREWDSGKNSRDERFTNRNGNHEKYSRSERNRDTKSKSKGYISKPETEPVKEQEVDEETKQKNLEEEQKYQEYLDKIKDMDWADV